MQRAAIVALRVLIIALLVLLLACQALLVPDVAEVTALNYPDVAFLKVPGIVVAVLFLVCVQLALLCIWQLLGLVQAGTIFSNRAYVYVDTVLVLIGIATAIALVAFVGLTVIGATTSANLVCLLGVVLGVSSGLLLFVMRGLVGKATQLEQDLSEVV